MTYHGNIVFIKASSFIFFVLAGMGFPTHVANTVSYHNTCCHLIISRCECVSTHLPNNSVPLMNTFDLM